MKVFDNDKQFNELLEKHNQLVKTLKNKVNRGIYDESTITSVSSQIPNALENDVKQFRENKLKELDQEQQEIEASYKNNVGYASRKDEAEEVKMSYALMDDWEIKNVVMDLNTDELLHLNLLRMELKNRKLTEESQKVKQYIAQNRLENQHEENERYQEIAYDKSVLHSIGNGGFYENGVYKTTDMIKNELNSFVNHAIQNPKKDTRTAEMKMQDFLQAK